MPYVYYTRKLQFGTICARHVQHRSNFSKRRNLGESAAFAVNYGGVGLDSIRSVVDRRLFGPFVLHRRSPSNPLYFQSISADEYDRLNYAHAIRRPRTGITTYLLRSIQGGAGYVLLPILGNQQFGNKIDLEFTLRVPFENYVQTLVELRLVLRKRKKTREKQACDSAQSVKYVTWIFVRRQRETFDSFDYTCQIRFR